MHKPRSLPFQSSNALNSSLHRRPSCQRDNDEEYDSYDHYGHSRNSDLSHSPEPHGRNFASLPSPHYFNNDDYNTAQQGHRQNEGAGSSKEIFPPSIQRYLSGNNQISMKEAVDKLTTPCKKAHDKNLEQMKFLTLVQQKEIHNNIIMRKTNSNSVASVSPTYAGSPVSSPMMYFSPKTGPASNIPDENIIMTYEDDDLIGNSSQALNSEMAFDRMNMANQPNMWKTNTISQSEANDPSNYGFEQIQQQQQNFMNPLPVHQENGNPFAQMNQTMQFNASQQVTDSFNNDQMQTNTADQDVQPSLDESMPIEETRERANSFLRKLSLPQNRVNFSPPPMGGNSPVDCKSLVSNQISVIQSLMESKRTLSPTDQNRGLMYYFQKRNSNPENIARSPMLPLQQQQQQQHHHNHHQQFQIQPQQMLRGQASIVHNHFGNFNGQNHVNMQQQQQQQQQQAQFMFHNQHQQNFMQRTNPHQNVATQGHHPQFNPQELEQRLYAEQGSYMSGPQSGKNSQEVTRYQSGETRGISTTNTSEQTNMDGFGFSYNSEMNQDWSLPNHDNSYGRGQDDDVGFLAPEAFLKNETEDFDMNIIQSDVNFMPPRFPPEGLGESIEDQFFMPESGVTETFFGQPQGRYNFDI